MRSMKAFNILYRSYFEKVFRSTYLVIHDETIAYDATQDAFLEAFINLHKLKDIDKLEPWISAVAANKARNMAKRNARMILSEDTEQLGDIEDSGDPLKLLINKERKEEILKILNKLDLKYREAIMLKYYYRLTDDEIGQLLKLPVGTVKTRLHRSREYLKEMLIIKKIWGEGNG